MMTASQLGVVCLVGTAGIVRCPSQHRRGDGAQGVGEDGGRLSLRYYMPHYLSSPQCCWKERPERNARVPCMSCSPSSQGALTLFFLNSSTFCNCWNKSKPCPRLFRRQTARDRTEVSNSPAKSRPSPMRRTDSLPQHGHEVVHLRLALGMEVQRPFLRSTGGCHSGHI